MFQVKLHPRKVNFVFDYVKFRRALPTVWIQRVIERNDNILENRILQTPSLSVHNKKKSTSDFNSICYYKLILLNSIPEHTNYCCLFWKNEFEEDIDWSKVFKRYFIFLLKKTYYVNSTLSYCIKVLLPVRKKSSKMGYCK